MCDGTSCLLVTRLSLAPKVSLDFNMFHNVSREEKVIFTIAGMRILLREEAALEEYLEEQVWTGMLWLLIELVACASQNWWERQKGRMAGRSWETQ